MDVLSGKRCVSEESPGGVGTGGVSSLRGSIGIVPVGTGGMYTGAGDADAPCSPVAVGGGVDSISRLGKEGIGVALLGSGVGGT